MQAAGRSQRLKRGYQVHVLLRAKGLGEDCGHVWPPCADLHPPLCRSSTTHVLAKSDENHLIPQRSKTYLLGLLQVSPDGLGCEAVLAPVQKAISCGPFPSRVRQLSTSAGWMPAAGRGDGLRLSRSCCWETNMPGALPALPASADLLHTQLSSSNSRQEDTCSQGCSFTLIKETVRGRQGI